MIEILVFIIIVAFCFFTKKQNILYLIIFLLPFHAFFKACFQFFFDGGNIFSLWKEFAIIVFLGKVFYQKHLTIPRGTLVSILGFFLIVTLYFLFSVNFSDALATLRDHIFPLLLLIALIACPIDKVILRKIIIFFCISAFINCIFGFLQSFIYNLQISTIMGNIDYIDSSGYVVYKTSSVRIMDIERMSGILGGANTYGMYISYVISILFGVLFTNLKNLFSKVFLNFIYICLALSLLCVLLSFSRTGWAISLFSIILMLRLNNIKIKPKLIFSVLFILIVSFTVSLALFPSVGVVIESTFSGKEDSAADRGSNFFRGLEKNINEPFGHGLGTTDYRSIHQEFFTESAFMNIIYEIGLIGFLYLLFMHINLVLNIIKKKQTMYNSFASIAGSVSIATLVASFVSVNTYGMPNIYLWFMLLGLGLNRSFIPDSHGRSIKKLETVNELSVL